MKILSADDLALILEKLHQQMTDRNGVDDGANLLNDPEVLNSLKSIIPDMEPNDLQMFGLSIIQLLNILRNQNKSVKIVMTNDAQGCINNLMLQSDTEKNFNKLDRFEKTSQIVRELNIRKN